MEGNNISLSISEVEIQIEEMIDDFEKLVNSGQLPPRSINGFVFMLSIKNFPEDQIGANISLSLLERSVEDRYNIISALGDKLGVEPEEYINHLNEKGNRMLNGLFRTIRRLRE